MTGFVVIKLTAVSKQYYLLKKKNGRYRRETSKAANAAMLFLLELSAVELCARYLQSVHLCW